MTADFHFNGILATDKKDCNSIQIGSAIAGRIFVNRYMYNKKNNFCYIFPLAQKSPVNGFALIWHRYRSCRLNQLWQIL